MTKSSLLWISVLLIFLAGSGLWVWNRLGPSQHQSYQEITSDFPVAQTIDSASNACDLTIRRYRQVGSEMQFELAATVGGLSPYNVEVSQNGRVQQFSDLPHRYGTWLTLPGLDLTGGEATVKVISLGQNGCTTTAKFDFDGANKNSIADPGTWIRHGSKDNWLDVRPVVRDGKLFLQDFAHYQDGRTKVTMIDGIAVQNLDKGIEVKPGYLYSVTARWIDAPYNDWWNELKNRTVRQQNIWINPTAETKENTTLTRIAIPAWFAPARELNVQFDTKFPEFEPIKGKLVAHYRVNDDVPSINYYNRGIGYLFNTEIEFPSKKMHTRRRPIILMIKMKNGLQGFQNRKC